MEEQASKNTEQTYTVVRCQTCFEAAVKEHEKCRSCEVPLTGKEPKYIHARPYTAEPRDAIKPLAITLFLLLITPWKWVQIFLTIFFSLQCLYYLVKFTKSENKDQRSRAERMDEMLSRKP